MKSPVVFIKFLLLKEYNVRILAFIIAFLFVNYIFPCFSALYFISLISLVVYINLLTETGSNFINIAYFHMIAFVNYIFPCFIALYLISLQSLVVYIKLTTANDDNCSICIGLLIEFLMVCI